MWGILLDYEANVLNRWTRNQETYSRKVAENGSMGRCLWRPEGWQKVDHVSVQFSHQDSSQPRGLHHARLPCPPTPRVYSNSCPLSWWCHPTISSLPSPSPPALNLAQHQGLFKWVSSLQQVAKVTAISASASVHSMNSQDWFPLGWTGWTSLLSKGLSRVLSNTTVQRHQFFSAQLSL